MATVKPGSGTAAWAYPIFLGLGLGCAVTGTVVAAQLSTPPAFIALATGLMLGGRSFGGSIALPIYNSLFSSQLSKHLAPEIAAEVLPLGATAEMLPQIIQAVASLEIGSLMKIDGMRPDIFEAAIRGMHQAYTPAFRNLWIVAGCFAFLATLGEFQRTRKTSCQSNSLLLQLLASSSILSTTSPCMSMLLSTNRRSTEILSSARRMINRVLQNKDARMYKSGGNIPSGARAPCSYCAERGRS